MSQTLSGAGLFNDGGLLQLVDATGWPTSATGLSAGDFYTIGGAIYVVPGSSPGAFPRVIIDGTVSASQLLGVGGANLPTTDPARTGQYWSNAGLLCVSLVTVNQTAGPPNFPQNFGERVPGVVGMSAIGVTAPAATQIYAKYSVFSLVLPLGVAQLPKVSGVELTILNRGANNLIMIPDQGGQIEQMGIDVPVAVGAGGNATFVCVDVLTPFAVGRQWRVGPTGPPPGPGYGLFNDGGLLQLTVPALWPQSGAGLAAGDLYTIGGAIYVVPGATPNPAAPAVMDGTITSYQFLALGGGNLPVTDPVRSGQYWSQGGLVCVSLGL